VRRNVEAARYVSGHHVGYARVSTNDQNLDRQIDALGEAGCDKIFSDQGASGSHESRPGLDALLEYLRPSDVLVVQALDRLGRTTRTLLELVETLRQRGIDLRILNLGVDTRTPAGQLVLTVVAGIAEMERAQLRERTLDGLFAARQRGRVGGRPPRMTFEQVAEARRLREDGRSIAEIARLFRVSERTVRRNTP